MGGDCVEPPGIDATFPPLREARPVSSEPADDAPAPGREALLATLEVRRHARRAVAFAAVFAVAVALYFVVVVSGGRTEWPVALYPALAFVVFVTTAMLALAVLVGRRVLALSVHPATLVRAGARGGLLAGLLWLLAAVGLQLGPARPWATVVDVATPWAPLVTPLGLWAVYTRYKRTTALRPVAWLAALVAVGGALVLADLAAFDLTTLLPAVGRPVDGRTATLYAAGAVALVGGQVALALLALFGDASPGVPFAVSLPPLAGLAALLALGPGRPGLAAFATGLGLGWVLASWPLRTVDDESVPAGPDPEIPGPEVPSGTSASSPGGQR